MSGSLGDLTVRFTGDASQLTATISEVQGALSEIQSTSAGATNATNTNTRAVNSNATAVRTQSERLQTFGKSIDTVTKPVQIASAALAAGGVAAASFAINFENNFADVKKTVEGTPQQLKEVEQGIIALTTTGIDGRNPIPQTTAQLTELAAAGGQLGIETENIVEFTETMAQMGTATNLYGAEGAATLARFMNVTNTSQDQVKNLGSAIVDLGNNFATSESEIATLGLRMGATGNVVGISAQDILGYSTALSSMGIEAEAGGSAVSRIWMDIQSAVSSGGEGLATFAKVSGKSSTEFAEQWKSDASGAFQTFLQGLSKSEDQVTTLSELGFNNIRDIQALQRLASEKGIQLVTEALQRANTAWTENIALQKEADAKAETTAGQIQIMKQNLVEAGRSIGESFLPMIAEGSVSVKEFAQGIANMSDEGKKNLIGVATGIVAVGAGAKAVSSSVKGIGDFVEALGKMGIAVPSLASMGPVALAVAGSIAAVTGAVYLGVKAYEAYQDAQHDVVKVTNEQIQVAKESVDEYEKLQDIQNQARNLETIIKTSTDSTEVEDAKSKLEELKNQVEEEYKVTITVDGDIDFARLDNRAISNMLGERGKLQGQLNSSDFGAAVENMNDYSDQLQMAQNSVDQYSTAIAECTNLIADLGAEQNRIDGELASGTISREEWVEKRSEAAHKYAEAINEIYEASGINEIYDDTVRVDENDIIGADLDKVTKSLLLLRTEFGKAQTEMSKFSAEFDTYSAEVEQWKEGLQAIVDINTELIPEQIANGKYQQAMSGISTALHDVKTYTQEMGFDSFAGSITEQLTIAQQGFSNISQVAQSGSEGINNFINDFANNAKSVGASSGEIAKSMATAGASMVLNGAEIDDVVNSYIDTSQKFGASAEQTAVGAALIKNGFYDIASAAKTDRGLEIISQQATDTARRLDRLPDEKHIEVSASGDLSIVDTASGKIQELQRADGTVVRVDADGNVEMLDKAGNQVAYLEGIGAVEIQVNAQTGNLEALDEAGNVVANLSEQGTQSVNIDVTATTNQAKATISALNNEQVTVPVDANTGSAQEKIAALDGTTITVNVSYNPVNSPFPNAKGTSDFKGGMAIINDEKGISDPRELVEVNGKGYIFEGRDVVVPLPKHAKVYTAAQTQEILSAIPHYASGKNNEAWETAKSDREHIRKTTYSIIPAWEELEWLDEMKREFASDAEVIKEIEEDVVTYTREMWQEDLDAMEYAYNMGWTTQEEYYQSLAAYRDENFAPDTEEYRDATLKLHKYAVQQIDDANNVSKAYIDLHGSLNDWAEMGTGMGEVWQTVNKRNVQAANDGLITWEDYFDTRTEYTEQFINNYLDYSDDWIKQQQEYNAMSAADTIAAIQRQREEVERFFSEIGELTDEEYVLHITAMTELDRSEMEAYASEMSEWEDNADWHEKQAGVYGWNNMNDTELGFLQRKYDKYMSYWRDEKLSDNDRQYALRQADEMLLEIYKATEDGYDELLDLAQDRMDEVEQLLDEKLSALEKSWEVEDRTEDKAKTLSDIEKYKNAVTIEGKEKYQAALDELKEIEREEEKYQLELENNAIIEQMQAEYEALEAEKERILQQTRDANLAIADMLEPFKQDITDNTQLLIDTLKEEIAKIQPSVTITQNNEQYINDKTDAILYSNKSLNQILEGLKA